MSTLSSQNAFGTTPGALRDDDAAGGASVAADSPMAEPLTPAGSDTESASEPMEGIARTRRGSSTADPLAGDTDIDTDDDLDTEGDMASRTGIGKGRGANARAAFRDKLSGTADRLAGVVDTTMQRRDEWMESARSEVRAHPMAAVAAAFVAGIVFDRMRRPRSSIGE